MPSQPPTRAPTNRPTSERDRWPLVGVALLFSSDTKSSAATGAAKSTPRPLGRNPERSTMNKIKNPPPSQRERTAGRKEKDPQANTSQDPQEKPQRDQGDDLIPPGPLDHPRRASAQDEVGPPPSPRRRRIYRRGKEQRSRVRSTVAASKGVDDKGWRTAKEEGQRKPGLRPLRRSSSRPGRD